MNLITDKWIPVKDSSNKTFQICPAEIVTPGIFLDFPRPDFNLSCLLFLIGLVQLVRKSISQKPTEAELAKLLFIFKDHFNLISEGKNNFMQDKNIQKEKYQHSIFSLLLDGTKEHAIKQGRDFFKKNKMIETLCPSCAGIALITNQIFAYKGGPAYYTSPLYNLLLAYNEEDDLWDTIFANTSLDFCSVTKFEESIMFPWSVSDSNSKIYLAGNIPKEHIFWTMPWRFYLPFEETDGICDCCGRHSKLLARQIYKSNKGIQYLSTKFVIYQGESIDEIQCGDIGEVLEKENETTYKVLFGNIILTIKEDNIINLDEISWDHPMSIFRKENKVKFSGLMSKQIKLLDAENKLIDWHINSSSPMLNHVTVSEILYELGDYKLCSKLKTGNVVLCGTYMDSSKYIGYYEKSIPFWEDRKELVESFIEVEKKVSGLLWQKTFPSAERDNLIKSLEESLDSAFYDILSRKPENAQQQWMKVLITNSFRIFDTYLPNEFNLRKSFIEELKRIDTTIESINPKRHFIKKQKLSNEAIYVILRWWSWINKYSKSSKFEIKNSETWKDIQAKDGFLNIFNKLNDLSNEVPSSDFINRLELAVFLVTQLQDDDKTIIFNFIPFGNDFFAKVNDLKMFFKEQKKANIINIFNKILFSNSN